MCELLLCDPWKKENHQDQELRLSNSKKFLIYGTDLFLRVFYFVGVLKSEIRGATF